MNSELAAPRLRFAAPGRPPEGDRGLSFALAASNWSAILFRGHNLAPLTRSSMHRTLVGAILAVFVISGGAMWLYHASPAERSEKSEADREKARAAYFHRMLQDPATGRIPAGIRTRELKHAATIPQSTLSKTSGVFFDWTEMGPTALAGRTRALAVDATDSNTLLAGSVSGGVWKSTNGGGAWRLTSEYLGVTSIAQDRREGHTDTWYFSTGETTGSTSSEMSISPFYGNGVYKSVDGGESWSLLASTEANPTNDESPFSHTWRIRVSPVSGTVFVGGNGFGVYRSTDEGETFEKVLGTMAPRHVEVAVGDDGNVLAVLSTLQREGAHDATDAGIFISRDDGATWNHVDTSALPHDHYRSVAAFAPSNPNHAYVWTEGADETPFSFVRVSLDDLSVEDRTANLPDFSEHTLRTQGSYDMALAIKPDDEDFIVIGGVEMFRSRDGFATPQTDEEDVSVRRATTGSLCVDHHEYVFDRTQPSRIWIGCDQGIFTTSDVTGAGLFFRNLNAGYNVSQFYAASMRPEAGDQRIIGGMQDWGSVEFEAPTHAALVGVGDGGYSYLGLKYAFSSLQNGRVFRHTYQNGTPRAGGTEVNSGVGSAFFITPFAVDPVDESVLFFPSFNILWRYVSTSNSPQGPWQSLDGVSLPQEHLISALSVSTEPAHVLYYGTWSPAEPSRLLRLDSANVAMTGAVDVSIPGLPERAWTSSIAINPYDADELVVAYSNYNINGLYHSSVGGGTWESIEGNLLGSESLPGPSIRSATILPVATGTVYLVGTSTGVYSTDDLEGSATIWEKEGADAMGNVIVAQISSRPSDGRVLVATHGRGVFVGGRNSNPVAIEGDDAPLPSSIVADVEAWPNPFAGSLNIGFRLANPARVNVALFDVLGRKVRTGSVADLATGPQVLQLIGDDIASGSYVYRLGVESRDGRVIVETGVVVRR